MEALWGDLQNDDGTLMVRGRGRRACWKLLHRPCQHACSSRPAGCCASNRVFRAPCLQITRGDRPADSRSTHGAAQVVLEQVLGRHLVRSAGLTLDRVLAASNAATRCAKHNY